MEWSECAGELAVCNDTHGLKMKFSGKIDRLQSPIGVCLRQGEELKPARRKGHSCLRLQTVRRVDVFWTPGACEQRAPSGPKPATGRVGNRVPENPYGL